MSFLPEHIPAREGNERAAFSDTVLGADGCVYGIPSMFTRFVKVDPKDDSIKVFGPDLVNDLGFDERVRYGVLANDGSIYVIQFGSEFMLKVDTNKGENNGLVEAFEVEYPQDRWLPRPRSSGVLGPDGYLYFPFSKHTIMRFDIVSRQAAFPFPSKNPVGLAGGININDGRLFALPEAPSEFDPHDEEITFSVDLRNFSSKAFRLVLGTSQTSWRTHRGGVFGRDGHLYFLNYLSQVVRLDACSGSFTFTPTPNESTEVLSIMGFGEFGSPCLGSDGCIYWPPMNQDRILKYDPYDETLDFVGISTPFDLRWSSGVTVSDGKTYFFPYFGLATQVLVVDPFGDFQAEIRQRIESDPLKFGRIFQIEDRSRGNHTLFDVGAKKFGMEIMLQMLDECIQKNQEAFNRSGYPVSLLAALYEECPLVVIYHLMRTSIGEMKYHLESALSETALVKGEVNQVNIV